jgi:hypothetical protein
MTNRTIAYGATSALLSLVAVAAAAPAAPAKAPLIAAPTAVGAGLPAKLPAFETLKPYSGVLDCDSAGTTCLVRNLPLLNQSDPAISAALDSFIAPIISLNPIPKLDKDGKQLKDANGDGVVLTVAEVRDGVTGVACYDTSIVSVIHAALANRGADAPKLVNRTAYFDALKRWEEFGLTRAQRQQVWQNYLAFLGQNKLVDAFATPKAVPQPMFFHEAAADIGGGEIAENCNPYLYRDCAVATAKNEWAATFVDYPEAGKALTNEMIIERMKSGFVTMIAYQRFNPESAGVSGGVNFRLVGFHKVVFAGFQPGPYPLLVYDVGNGTPYKVRLSANIGDMTFNIPATPKPTVRGVLKSLKREEGVISYSEVGQKTYLAYEGEEAIANPQIKVVESVEGLRIAPPAKKLGVPELVIKRRIPVPAPEPSPRAAPDPR